MKKTNLTGWKDVFSFTLIQALKNKAFIISYIILMVIILLSMPLVNIIMSGGTTDPDAPNPIQKVYVDNQSTLPDMEFTEVLKNQTMSHITFEPLKEDYDTVAERIDSSENSSVILTIADQDGMFSLNFVKASKGPVKDISLNMLGEEVSKQFEIFKLKSLGVTEEQTAIIYATVDTLVTKADINGEPIIKENTSISNTQYWFMYGILFVVMMIIMMAGGQVASSVVTEKSSRVLEYLLTSVKPLALIVGKILAMLLVTLIQMVSMVVLLFVSNQISAQLNPGGGSVISQYVPEGIFQNLSLTNILICFVSIILGLIFYATLAGLVGATISKIEEMSDGMMLYTFTALVGIYMALGASNSLMSAGENAYATFTLLFPLSSPFILPGAILIGKASISLIIASVILQIIFMLLLMRFVAKVFEVIILHNGSKIKLKELINISKTA